MIIVKIWGGLGNQMFQYALGRYLSIKNKKKLVLDYTELKWDKDRTYELQFFNLSKKTPQFQLRYIPKIIKLAVYKIISFFPFYIKEEKNVFNEDIKELKKKFMYLEGYWQSEKYFKEIRKTLLKDFQIYTKPDKKNKDFLELIKKSNSVAIHIRRNDRIKNKVYREIHGTPPVSYYYNAVKFLKKKIKNPVFFFFSDDPKWVKKNLKIKGSKSYYLDHNDFNHGFEDFRLLMNCKHFILGNSTFSWWAAWLCENPKKLICGPRKWYSDLDEGDLVPKRWVRI